MNNSPARDVRLEWSSFSTDGMRAVASFPYAHDCHDMLIAAADHIDQLEREVAELREAAQQRWRDGLDEALRVVLDEHLVDPQNEDSDRAYDRAVRDCAEAIRNLMRQPPAQGGSE